MGAALVIASGCSGDEGAEGAGDVSLGLHLGPTNVATVHYVLSGNGLAPRAGDIDVSDAQATPSIVLGGIPAGSGYLISLTATSTDAGSACAGSATVNVAVGVTTSVAIELLCRSSTMGGAVTVSASLHVCPSIGSFQASPLRTSIGGSIDLAVDAYDDDTPHPMLAWSAPPGAGGFTDPTAPRTRFICAAVGTFTLGVVVSDGFCADSAHVSIACVSG
jgi:hypothetical protein